jgi:hypothetical protein
MHIVTRRTTALGLISWIVPFAVSFLFVDRSGQFLIPQTLFKSLMVVIFGGLGTGLLVLAFRRVAPSLRSGALLGCYWLGMNLVLDLVVLLPLIRMPVVDYAYDIGLRYLLIPIVGAGMGAVGQGRSGEG